jgi:hypothetical protein
MWPSNYWLATSARGIDTQTVLVLCAHTSCTQYLCQRWPLERTGLLPNITKSGNLASATDKRDDVGMAYLDRWSGSQIPARACWSTLSHNEPHIKWARGTFPGLKRPGRDVAHSPLYTAGGENKQSCASELTLRLCFVVRDNFISYDTVIRIHSRY